jgi:sirohydrochlorin ferrochelatase
MKGVLILAHGSRQKETEETLQQIVDMTRASLPSIPLEYAFLQFSDKNLETGLKNLIEEGVTQIKVVPYFLFEGVHIREDIPGEIQEFLKGYDNIEITFGKTLGADMRLAAVLADRIKEIL